VDATLRLRLPPCTPVPLRDALALLRRQAPAARAREVPPAAPASILPRSIDTRDIAVDVVVCVHDALDAVRDCLDALARAWRPQDRLVIVDDASGPGCANHLHSHAAVHAGRTLLRHDGAAWGYCRSANHGIAQGRAPWVLLLNSDTVLPAGALGKMLQVGLLADDIGLVGPLSNAAQFQSIPEVRGKAGQTAINTLPPGVDAARLDACCAAWAQGRARPVVPLVHGFCLLVRRAVFDQVGLFDEAAFPEGYGEEHDLCLRAGDAGWRCAVATDAFVQHAKSASYRDPERRERLMRAGFAKLAQRHGATRLNAALQETGSHPELVRLRALARNWFQAQAATSAQAGVDAPG
jgi:GT2 family glycosyltransferase